MATAPENPKYQGSLATHGAAGSEDVSPSDHLDGATGAQSGQPGDADINLKEQGRFGSLSQNLTTIRNVQER